MRRIWLTGVLLAGPLFARQVGAQNASVAREVFVPRPALSLSVGVSQFDLSGTGTTAIVAARGELPLVRVLLLEGGVAIARPEQQFGVRTTLVMPEVQLQLQVPRRVAPYLGAGGGLVTDFRGEGHGGRITRVTLSGAGGVRVALTRQFGARAELRVRGIGLGFGGSTADWTLGGAWRF